MRLKMADFYYGAVLSSLFNAGIRPALIEGGKAGVYTNSQQIK